MWKSFNNFSLSQKIQLMKQISVGQNTVKWSLANAPTSMLETLRKCHLNKDEIDQAYHYLEMKEVNSGM